MNLCEKKEGKKKEWKKIEYKMKFNANIVPRHNNIIYFQIILKGKVCGKQAITHFAWLIK